MATVTLSDELAAKLRACVGDESADLDDLVEWAVVSLVGGPRVPMDEMIRAADELDAALTKAGITEEELIEHFHQWRRRQRSGS